VTSLAGELAIGQDYGSQFAAGGDSLGGIDGLEVEDVAIRESVTKTGEVDHANAPVGQTIVFRGLSRLAKHHAHGWGVTDDARRSSVPPLTGWAR
jgi:hypothetical protein